MTFEEILDQAMVMLQRRGRLTSGTLKRQFHSHQTQGWLVLESASVSYGKATPYFPVLDLLRRYAQVDEGDAPHPASPCSRAASDPGRDPPGRHPAAAGPARRAPG